MSKRDYHFVDRWTIPVGIATVEDAIMDYDHWSQWWDGLEFVEHLTDTIGLGAKFLCVWRGAAWYKLRLEMTITKYEPGKEFTFDAGGDLVGSGAFNYESTSDNSMTIIKIDWNVSTVKPWMNHLSWLLRPVFVTNHSRIMRQGEIGLRKYIEEMTKRKGETHG